MLAFYRFRLIRISVEEIKTFTLPYYFRNVNRLYVVVQFS